MLLLPPLYILKNWGQGWKGRVPGHTASNQQSQDINPRVPESKICALHYSVEVFTFTKWFKMKKLHKVINSKNGKDANNEEFLKDLHVRKLSDWVNTIKSQTSRVQRHDENIKTTWWGALTRVLTLARRQWSLRPKTDTNIQPFGKSPQTADGLLGLFICSPGHILLALQDSPFLTQALQFLSKSGLALTMTFCWYFLQH